MNIPLNKPMLFGNELEYIKQVLHQNRYSGDGNFTKKCNALLEKKLKTEKVLLTTSCTHALEMAALIIDLKHDDEVILPSYTFTSTANAVMLRGAKPVFVDIRRDTKNIDETLIEKKITKKTKAIFPVHYAGIACEMDAIMRIARKYDLFVVEDAAQALNGTYKNHYLGTIGDFGCFSFHESKNLFCGEGGALAVKWRKYVDAAEIIREKGTDRSKFYRGEVDKYGWKMVGSSYLPSEVAAALLLAQLEHITLVQRRRAKLFRMYLEGLKTLETDGLIEMPVIPPHIKPSYHIFYIMVKNNDTQKKLMSYLKDRGIFGIFHYQPLHNSVMGKNLGYKTGDLPVTEDVSERLVRLPMYNSLTLKEQREVITAIKDFYS